MRGYECIYYANFKGEWRKNPNTACWAGLSVYSAPMLLKIKYWEAPETKQYAAMLVNLINKITPCYLEDECIYYQMIVPEKINDNYPQKYYDRNLVLLNFIRYLWSDLSVERPPALKDIPYELEFFKALAKSRYKDPFKRLSKANAIYSEYWFTKREQSYPPGHSNIQKGNKILSTAQFLESKRFASNMFI